MSWLRKPIGQEGICQGRGGFLLVTDLRWRLLRLKQNTRLCSEVIEKEFVSDLWRKSACAERTISLDQYRLPIGGLDAPDHRLIAASSKAWELLGDALHP